MNEKKMNHNMRTIYPFGECMNPISIVEQAPIRKMANHVHQLLMSGVHKEALLSGHYDHDDAIARYERTGILPVGRRHEDYFEIFDRQKQLKVALDSKKKRWEEYVKKNSIPAEEFPTESETVAESE